MHPTRVPYEGRVILCTDPIHLVKDPEPGVIYVPRDVEQQTPDKDLWSSCSLYVATHFLTRPGPWVLEGVGVPRALRKVLLAVYNHGRPSPPKRDPLMVGMACAWANATGFKLPIDKLIVLRTPRAPQLPGQIAMGKGALKVLEELRPWLGERIEWR